MLCVAIGQGSGVFKKSISLMVEELPVTWYYTPKEVALVFKIEVPCL